MQYTQTSNENAAREAWQTFMSHHPRVHGFLSITGSFFGYFFNGHALVAFVMWMARVAGRIAESALLLATLYVTFNYIAHTLVTWWLDQHTIDLLNYLSIVTFSILPELIVASAIIATLEHWILFFRNRSWRNVALVWSVLYSIPTIAFIVMTITTISNSVDTYATAIAHPGSAYVVPTATGVALVIRFLSGWFYSLVEMLFANIGKKGYVAMLDNLGSIITELRTAVNASATEVKSLQDSLEKSATETKNLQDVMANKDKELSSLREKGAMEIAHLHSLIATRDNDLNVLRNAIEEKDSAIDDLRSALEKANRSRALRRVALTQNQEVAPVAHSTAMVNSARSDAGNDYVAIDDGDSIAVSNGQGATVIATGEVRERIKIAMVQALHDGEKINYGEIARVAQAGYSTVRKHAKTIIEEIESELQGPSTGELPALHIVNG